MCQAGLKLVILLPQPSKWLGLLDLEDYPGNWGKVVVMGGWEKPSSMGRR
jgi:hypothetical protein